MPNNQKTTEQLQAEALEFLKQQYKANSEQIKQLEEYQTRLEDQISALGGVVPSDETSLYEVVERYLTQSYRLVREDDLVAKITEAEKSWLSVRNPKAQIQKAITQSCKVWKNKPTKFFRFEGWLGLYAWKQWIIQDHPDLATLTESAMQRFGVSNQQARLLADSLIESGAIHLTA